MSFCKILSWAQPAAKHTEQKEAGFLPPDVSSQKSTKWSSDVGFPCVSVCVLTVEAQESETVHLWASIVPNCCKCKMLSSWKGVIQLCCSFWAWHKFLSSVIKGNPVVTEVSSSTLFVGQIRVAPESSEPKRGNWLYGPCLALWLNYPTRAKHGLPWWLKR